MVIHPKVRGFICTTAHPVGCAKHVQDQIDYVWLKKDLVNGPKNVLVVGSSTGYGLSSRIVSAFGGSRAATIGVFFEKEAEDKRTATAGWYNSVAFESKAHEAGLYAKSFNGDAFGDEMKERVVAAIKKDWDGVDLLVYSLASPRRVHPKTGKVCKSVLKPIGQSYTNHSIDLSKNELEEVTLKEATQEEIDQTVAVMGGEDWQFWVNILEERKLLSRGFKTVAYSYIGPQLTQAIYRNGTIGRAKDHLEDTAGKLNARLKTLDGSAYISVNKALVTQSSSAIPFIPLYFVLLKKAMVEMGTEEDCIEQIYRLFSTQLYSGKSPHLDSNGFIRMDNLELNKDIQRIVNERWNQLTKENLKDVADLDGYQKDFMRLFGFGLSGVDYNADVDHCLPLPSQTQSV